MKRPIQHTPARAPEAIQFARDQRTTANELAQSVWQWIRNRQFCCVELKLVLEIDGADHVTAEGQERDRERDEALAQQGLLVARIPGYDVLREPERVLAQIEECVRNRMRELGVV